MKKVISYRQKIIELAKIYKINKVLDPNLKLTTYEIELELKNKVPIPSRKGYFSHKITNEILKPFYSYISEKLTINLNKTISKINSSIKEKLIKDFNLKKKLSINFNLNKTTKVIFNKINNYGEFVIFNIDNFF